MAAKDQKDGDKSSKNINYEKSNSVSRVCIKNLPPSCSESNLKAHLTASTNGNSASITITDCKILRTKDGKSRKLAFVGLKTPQVSNTQTHKSKNAQMPLDDNARKSDDIEERTASS